MFHLLKLVCLISFIMPFSAAYSARHFTEVYEINDAWRVDHFVVQANQLQDLKEIKSFRSRIEAEAYARKIQKLNQNQKSSFRLVQTESKKPLWIVKEQWSADWEAKYAEWISKNLTADYFIKHNFATDCADVAYALRWIFAREAGLPASATLAGTGLTVTQDSAKDEWDSLPGGKEWDEDKRFSTALDWLLNNVYTKTLVKDAYPVKISRETITPGLIHLISVTHTEVFSKVSYVKGEVPFEIMSSTLPRAVRKLFSGVFMAYRESSPEAGGLLKFRWPVYMGGT